mmetsp:Transcript_34117/g.54627  ORF Transcript_34117/g.54627 Transcript_34117/m.54627 type:complete len:96 (-) Transcript_34117:1647-1934(-)
MLETKPSCPDRELSKGIEVFFCVSVFSLVLAVLESNFDPKSGVSRNEANRKDSTCTLVPRATIPRARLFKHSLGICLLEDTHTPSDQLFDATCPK